MEFDYIIAGAGSAGCVLANRLTEDPSVKVLLIEAGGRDWHPFIHMPAGLAKLVGIDRINWSYQTEPEAQLNGRSLYWPRGKVLGGSSSINAMCYCRGHRKDYDSWAAGGATGWGFDDVLPFFIKSEDQQNGASEYHGVGGPLNVENLRHTNPLSKVFLEAAEQAGHPRTDDFNGPHQRGVDYYQVTQRNGRRCSTAVAYLNPARKRPNLVIRTRAQVERIVFDGLRATGVEYRKSGKSVRANGGHVILSGGAINSPQLLMLSGIGPRAHLEDHGIKVRLDLPGVGQNLQDHLDICTLVKCRGKVTYDQINDVAVGLKYLFQRQGPGTSNIAEAGAFVLSQFAEDDRPDIQMHFIPALLDDHGRNTLPGSGMTLHACVLRPRSVGSIRLKSADPLQAPAMHANYLDHEYDRRMMVECARLSLAIFGQKAFEPWVEGRIFPEDGAESDEELLDFVRRKAETVYHPIGTCRMGSDDGAVVDPLLRVRGVEGLSVVDASVMPSLVSGNTNAPTIMIAEKFASMQ